MMEMMPPEPIELPVLDTVAERRRADRRCRAQLGEPPSWHGPERRKAPRRAGGVAPPAASAAALRQARQRAMGLLAACPSRSHLTWSDLGQLPDWACMPLEALEAMAWRAGAWAYADELRRCIDGRVLKVLRECLGDDMLAALMKGKVATGDLGIDLPPLVVISAPIRWGRPAFEPGNWMDQIASAGRECVLASVPSRTLRQALRELLWPETAAAPAGAKEPNTAAAQAVWSWVATSGWAGAADGARSAA